MKSVSSKIACFFICLAATGCDGRLKLLAAPGAIVWNDDGGHFKIRNKPEMTGRFGLDGRRLSVTVWEFPRGLPIELGGDQELTDDEGYASVHVDVTAALASVPTDKLESARLDHGLSLVLRPKGRPPITHALPPIDIGHEVVSLLKAAEKGPVRFGDEPVRAAGAPRSVIDVGEFEPALYGSAATIAEIDAVARYTVGTDVKGTKQCTGYISRQDGKPLPPVTMELKEIVVIIHDRRSGAVLDQRAFPPSEVCPLLIDATTTITSSMALPRDEVKEEIRAWLKAYVAGARPVIAEANAVPIE